MTGLRLDPLAARLAGPLRGVIGAVAGAGLLAAVVVAPGTEQSAPDRAGVGVDPAAPPGDAPAPPPEGAPAEPADGGEGVEPVPATVTEAGGGGPGLSVVPASGTYRYRVESIRDGQTTVQDEEREVTQLSGDRERALIRLTVRLEGESQVSVVDWSPDGARVQSTRIETAAGPSQDCSWSPPFLEFGALASGATWAFDSSCRTDVGGIDTTFRVTGEGRVDDAVTISSGGREVLVWRIVRERNTSITAALPDEQLAQQVRERGTVFFDPARGVIIRSEVRITLEGAQQGVTDRISVLQEG